MDGRLLESSQYAPGKVVRNNRSAGRKQIGNATSSPFTSASGMPVKLASVNGHKGQVKSAERVPDPSKVKFVADVAKT